MSKTSLKSTTSLTPPKRLPEDEKLADLRRRRAGILDEILALEAEGVAAKKETPASDRTQRALALLDDPDAKVVSAPMRPTAEARLHALRESLQDYDFAIQEAERRAVVAHQARSRELVAENSEAWANLQRQRVKAVVDLLRVNRQIEDMKKQMRSGGQLGSLPLDNFTLRLFGTGGLQTPVNHWAAEFLKAAAQAGLIDPQAFKNV